jgi:hypothetical protein
MPTTIEALVIVALVLLPGFVLARVAGGVIAFAREPGDMRFLLPTITCGTFVHIALSWRTVQIVDHYGDGTLSNHSWQVVSWGFVLVFAAPAVLGVVAGQLANLPVIDDWLDVIGLGYIDRMPSAWDYMIRSDRPGFVRVRLKEGGMLGGVFFNQSFASNAPERTDLFLEELWQLDEYGGFVAPMPATQGVWIAHDAIERVEVYLPITTEHNDVPASGDVSPR